ncbi:MAG: hypothetical protein OEW87_15460, partial [Flavobacteriaceae bacterium]|nr:hypothetical protein [Flavobacteriaceae bacterium]
MTRLTICPHYLFEYPRSSPESIEANIIQPLRECLEKAEDNDVDIVMSQEILRRFCDSYPWNLMERPEWKGYILTWHTLITQKIANISIILNIQLSNNCDSAVCEKLTPD